MANINIKKMSVKTSLAYYKVTVKNQSLFIIIDLSLHPWNKYGSLINSLDISALWAKDDLVNKQLEVSCDTNMNWRLTWSCDEIYSLLDFGVDNLITQQPEKTHTNHEVLKMFSEWLKADTISDQWMEWQLIHGFCWYILFPWNFACVQLNQTKGKMQMSCSFTDADQMNQTTGVKTLVPNPPKLLHCSEQIC